LRRALASLAFCATALSASSAPAQSSWLGGALEAPDREGDAAYAASAVSVPGRIGGDAMIMAGTARIDGEVGDDARVIAETFKLDGAVGGELAVAARKTDIDGNVGDDLYVAGEDVQLGQNTRIGQDARIFGEDVLIKGRISRNLDVSAETVAISARIAGDVTIHARHIILGPDAVIGGRLVWRSPNQPEIPQEAVVQGSVDGAIVKGWQREGVMSWASPLHGAPRAAIFAGEAAGRIMVALSAFVLGLFLVLLTPHYMDRVFATVRERWAVSVAWGFGLLLLAPIAAFIVMLTIVGIPLGILALLSLPIFMLWGYAVGAGAIGAAIIHRQTPQGRSLALVLGIAIVTVLAMAPFIGWLIGAVATMLGLGALAVALRARPIA
jgi:hypothetical protein